MKTLILIILNLFCLVNVSNAQNCKNILNLNTGYYASTPLAAGTIDNNWTVISGPNAGSCTLGSYPLASAVSSATWSAYPNTSWITFNSTSACTNICSSQLAPLVFQTKFCIKQSDTIIFNPYLRVDNSACLYIDNIPVPLTPYLAGTNTPSPAFNIVPSGNCATCEMWNDSRTFNGSDDARAINFKIFLNAGAHNIQIRVRNNSSAFSLLFKGTLASKTVANNFNCSDLCMFPDGGGNGSFQIAKVLDTNCNGKQDTGESLGANWTFTVTGPGGFLQSITTNSTGIATVSGLANGTYSITETPKPGWTPINTSQTIDVTNSTSPIVYFYNCKNPCIDITEAKIECDKIVNGVQTYKVTGLISNGNNVALNTATTSGSGTITGFTPNPVPANAVNQAFSFIYTPTSTNTNPCFIVSYTNDNGVVMCKKDFCLPLPKCPCLELSYKLECNKDITANTPQQYVYIVTITNPTSTAISIPMSSGFGVISPSVITATPGGPTDYKVYYTPNPGTTNACIKFGVGVVPLPIAICKIPVECVPLPDCPPIKPCADAAVLVTSCDIINGVQTLFVKGAISSGSALPTTLSVTSISGGTASLSTTTVVTVPANAINHPFTITLPSPTAANYCFEVTLTSFAAPFVTCKDTICVKNPCPPVVTSDCCPKTTIKPCVCPGNIFATYNFNSTIVAPVCKVEISATPSIAFLPSNVTVNGTDVGAFTGTTHTLSSVVGNVNFSVSNLATATTTFTVTYTLCNGSICKESFNVSPKKVGDVIVIDKTPLTHALVAYPLSIKATSVQKDANVKHISVLVVGEENIEDVIYAVTGAENFGDKNKSIAVLSEVIQGSKSVTFTLKTPKSLKALENDNSLNLSLITNGKLSALKFTFYDEEGALLSDKTVTSLSGSVVAAAQLQKDEIKINIAPNPAESQVKISYSTENEQLIHIDLIDITGNVIQSITKNAKTNQQEQITYFDVSNLNNGLYLIRFRNEKGQSHVEKLVVTH